MDDEMNAKHLQTHDAQTHTSNWLILSMDHTKTECFFSEIEPARNNAQAQFKQREWLQDAKNSNNNYLIRDNELNHVTHTFRTELKFFVLFFVFAAVASTTVAFRMLNVSTFGCAFDIQSERKIKITERFP